MSRPSLRLIRNERWRASGEGRSARRSLLLRSPGASDLTLTGLETVYWSREKITKGDLLGYYRKICPILLPYLKDRPHNLLRYPEGIDGCGIIEPSDGEAACRDEDGLLRLVELGCIELDPWNSRVQYPDRPDFLVIELEPERIGFDKVVEAAQAVRGTLDAAGVEGYCKTSGGPGLQVYVPLGAEYDFIQARQFAEIIATLVQRKLPAITGLCPSGCKRRKQVYLDVQENRRGLALAAPYSVRAFPGAPVSTPLAWKELKRGLDPAAFTMKTVFRRLEKLGDLFAPVLEKTADLELALQNLARAEG